MLPWYFPHFLREISNFTYNGSLTCNLSQHTLSLILLVGLYQISWLLPYCLLTLPFKSLIFTLVLLCSFWRWLCSTESPMAILLNKERWSMVLEKAGKGWSMSLPWEGKERSSLKAQHLQSQEDQASLAVWEAGLGNFPSCLWTIWESMQGKSNLYWLPTVFKALC